MNRPDNDEYFMEMAFLVSKRSTCLRRRVGAVIVRDKHVISTGYNGSPRGTKHCEELGCIRQQMNIPSGTRHELCRGVHAEQNAIIQAAKLGVSIEGATLYCTHQPCVICAKMIVNSGIKRVVYGEGYPDEFAMQMFEMAGVDIERYEEEEEK